MVTIGVIAGVIVAIGTLTTGLISVVNLICDHGRRKEREDAYKIKLAAELEDLKSRLPEH